MRNRSQALVLRENKILLVKHVMNGRTFYCLPGGGVEKDESYGEAALRELAEESNVKGTLVRELSVQYKPDNKGEVHTFLVEISADEEPSPGIDPEFDSEHQSIVGVRWLTIDQLGDVDKAYLWAAGLNRVPYFHEYLLNMENDIVD